MEAQRLQESVDLAPGRKPVLELLRADPGRVDTVLLQSGAHGREIGEIMELCRRHKVRFRTVDKAELARLYQGGCQGVLARVSAMGFVELDALLASASAAPLPLVLALDQVQDPGNLGALARTLYALGGAGIILPKDRSAFVGPGAAKASAGAIHKLPVARVTNLARALDQAAERGLMVYGAASSPGAQDVFRADLAMPAVLVLGNEEKGIRPNVARRCEQDLAIPMARDFDSLNVAQAGAIIMAAFARSASR